MAPWQVGSLRHGTVPGSKAPSGKVACPSSPPADEETDDRNPSWPGIDRLPKPASPMHIWPPEGKPCMPSSAGIDVSGSMPARPASSASVRSVLA